MGAHWIKAWSRIQATVALSSAESELYAMVKTSTEVMGVASILKDWGMHLGGTILGDASACLGVIQRQGLGKLRHINTNYLWVQEKAAKKELQFGKVWGKCNPGDLMTKFLPAPEIEAHLNRMSSYYREGRAMSAPKVVEETGDYIVANVSALKAKIWPQCNRHIRRQSVGR